MSLIHHPNVITAYCSFVVERNLWVVMPFMSEGSCLHLMKTAYPDGFEESAISSFLKETLKALVYLHQHGHIHRDVKVAPVQYPCCLLCSQTSSLLPQIAIFIIHTLFYRPGIFSLMVMGW